MKKDYIKPEITIEEFELKDCLLVEASYIPGTDQPLIPRGKDREDFEGEEESSWGTLW
jgi:hypothetical protein